MFRAGIYENLVHLNFSNALTHLSHFRWLFLKILTSSSRTAQSLPSKRMRSWANES